VNAWEANERYEGLREGSRDFSLGIFCTTIFVGDLQGLTEGLAFTAIDDAAMREWHATQPHWEFRWDEIVPHYRRNDTDRFEIAIWKQRELAGLGIGRVSNGPDNVTIHFLERCKIHTALKGFVAQIVTDSAEFYGKVLGKQRVKLKDPVEGAIAVYEKLRFSLAENIGKTKYYARSIGI
jgi:hypothetical protein